MLAGLCSGFETAVEKLDVKAEDFAFELKLLILGLVRDLAVLVGDASNEFGTVPAIMHLAHVVLLSLRSEADNPADRPCRYRREQALLNLLAFSSVVVGFYNLTHFDQRRQQNIDPLKTAVAQALGELVSSND